MDRILFENLHVHYVTWLNKSYRQNPYWQRLTKSAKKNRVDLVVCEYEKLDMPDYTDVRAVELGYFLQHPMIQHARLDDGIMIIGGDQAFIEKPHDLPPLDDTSIYMPYNIFPADSMLNDVKRRRGYVEGLKDLGFDGTEPARNTGAAYGSKHAWVNLHEYLKPYIEPFSQLFGTQPVWQCLISAMAYKLGVLKLMPMQFGAHDHGLLIDLGLKIIDGKVYTMDGEPAQIIHKFKDINI